MSVARRSSIEQAKYVLTPHLAIGTAKYRWERNESGELARVENEDDACRSYGTERLYLSSLKQLADFTADKSQETYDRKSNGYLHRIDEKQWTAWLEKRSHEVGTKQLNIDRRAIEVTYQVKITPLKSDVVHDLKSRAYTSDQIEMVMQCQRGHNRLATEIAWRCGLRAHELFTLRPASEQPRSDRRGWRDDLFGERRESGVPYTVEGKGGLVREVMMPRDLSERLEERRLDEPRKVYDLAIHPGERMSYIQHYDLGAGNNWSSSFSDASMRALGWSNGGHGLRHTYAQERMEEEQQSGRTWDEALAIISQEVGHFRQDITLVYLR